MSRVNDARRRFAHKKSLVPVSEFAKDAKMIAPRLAAIEAEIVRLKMTLREDVRETILSVLREVL